MSRSSSDEDAQQVAAALFNAGRYDEAFPRYRKFAENGSIAAQLGIGWMYHQGRGVNRDINEALRWYKAAASAGSHEAYFYLGILYRDQQRNAEAIECLERSAVQSYIPALYVLGLLYQFGGGVDIDRKKAYTYFKQASDMGHVFAQKEVALSMLKGHLGVSRIPKGIYMLVKVFFTGIKLAFTDRYSDKLYTLDNWQDLESR